MCHLPDLRAAAKGVFARSLRRRAISEARRSRGPWRLEIDHHAANPSITITGMFIACFSSLGSSKRLRIQHVAVRCMASHDHSASDRRACEPNILEFAITHRVQSRNRRLLGFPTPVSHQPAPQEGDHAPDPELPCYALRHSVPARSRSHNHRQPSNFFVMSAQARPHLIARRLSADIVGSLMWANDLSAGFLARDAGKVASRPMVQTCCGSVV